MILFSKAKMVLCAAKYTYPKMLFADRTAIREGRSRESGFAIAFVSCRLPVCTGLHDYSAVAGSARSCCDHPPCAKSVRTSFVSVLDRRYLFISYLSCSCWKLCAYRKVCPAPFVKGVGIEKGRGIPLPFSVFLVPFVTIQKERPFLFPLEKE